MKKMIFTFNPETREELGCNTYYKRDTTECWRIRGKRLFFNTTVTTTKYRCGKPEVEVEEKVSNRDFDALITKLENQYDLVRIG